MNKTGTHKNDRLSGGVDSDFLDGSLGNDTLFGFAGADVIRGGGDYPGSGEDFSVGVGDDWLDGGDGDDELDGGFGNDTLFGGAGNDFLDGGDSAFLSNDLYDSEILLLSNWLAGGAGNDTYVVCSKEDTVWEGSDEGVDEVWSSVDFVLPANVEGLVLSDLGAVRGTGNGLANSLTGNGVGNLLDGREGNDSIQGGGGNDTLIGGAGNDTLVDGVGATVVEGGDGVDFLMLDWGGLGAGVTFSPSGLKKVGTSYSGVYSATNGLGTVLASASFSGVESLLVNGVRVDLTPPAEPGVRVSRVSTSTSTSEAGGTVEFAVSLTAKPNEGVSLSFVSSDLTEGKVITPKLSFTVQNWNLPQVLRIQGVDDYEDDGNVAYSVRGSMVTSDLGYNRVKVPLINVSNLDDRQDDDRQISGGARTDYLTGANGNDRIYGGGGQDQIKGGRGNDRLYGQEDNDRLFGELGDDEMYGGYDDDTLDGGDGADSLFGEQSSDTLLGGDGNDYLDGGIGKDSMSGGIGNDTYLVDSAGDVINDSGAATDMDTVLVLQAISYTLPANVESAAVRSTGDANLTGNNLNNGLTGNEGRNVLDGGVGNDSLSGGGGADSLLGGVGNDVLAGGVGNDTIRGGEGVDVADFQQSGLDVVIDLMTGRVTGEGRDLLFDIENIVSGDGDDRVNGSAIGNVLQGGAGWDSVSGGAGNDTLSGCGYGVGGGAGEVDTLMGGSGTDIFQVGWEGGRFYDDGDALTSGNDDYVLITDFTIGQDKLQLDGARTSYLIGSSGVSGVAGAGLFYDSNSNGKMDRTDELIAIIRSSDGSALGVGNTVGSAVFV